MPRFPSASVYRPRPPSRRQAETAPHAANTFAVVWCSDDSLFFLVPRWLCVLSAPVGVAGGEALCGIKGMRDCESDARRWALQPPCHVGGTARARFDKWLLGRIAARLLLALQSPAPRAPSLRSLRAYSRLRCPHLPSLL